MGFILIFTKFTIDIFYRTSMFMSHHFFFRMTGKEASKVTVKALPINDFFWMLFSYVVIYIVFKSFCYIWTVTLCPCGEFVSFECATSFMLISWCATLLMEGYQNKTECATSFWANFRDVLYYLWRGTKLRHFYYINYEGIFSLLGT